MGSNNGNNYVYSGGRSNHPVAAGPPGYGFVYGKKGGKYISLDIVIDTLGREAQPNEVIFVSDIAYNQLGSYPGVYYGNGYKDPSNHRDERVTTPGAA